MDFLLRAGNIFFVKDTDKATSNGGRPLTGCSSGITAVDIKLNIEQKFTDCPESVACNKLYSQTEIPSRYVYYLEAFGTL